MGSNQSSNKKKTAQKATKAKTKAAATAVEKAADTALEQPVFQENDKPTSAAERKSIKAVKKLLSSSSKESSGFKEGLVLKSEMDLTVKPGDDFWRYANGGWIDNNPVPDEFARYGTFEVLNELTLKNLHVIANTAKDQSSPDAQRLAALWESGMNTEKLEELKFQPIEGLLEEINNITDAASIAKVVARFHLLRFPVLFNVSVRENLKNSSQCILYVDQGGLGMPNRDFYMEEEKKETREKYVAFIAEMFALAGSSAEEAAAQAAQVMELEMILAEASLRTTDRRNPDKLYHPETFDSIKALFAPFDFQTFAESFGVAEALGQDIAGPINNTVPAFLAEGLSKALGSLSLDHLKAYLRFHALNDAAEYLHTEVEEARFRFFGTVLSGQKEQKPRWKRVLGKVGLELGRGEVLGKLYCEKHFPEESKTKMLEYIAEVKDALTDQIQSLEWMSEETKKAAIRKVNAFGYMIGFPEKWADVSSLTLSADAYFENISVCRKWAVEELINDLNGPPDKTRWGMPPHMINAYFSPSKNLICFPAAILQAPFFSKDFDPALCFGGICSVIGHEMVHSFDDSGSKFDHEGNVHNWWTDEDRAGFEERAKVIIEQFDNFTVHGLNVQGSLTQGENIADLGGMKVSFKAMQNYFKKHGRQPDIDGFTPEQRFFINWARGWRNNITEDRAKTLVTIDPHAPAMYRVLGPMSNLQEFYDAFDVKEGDKMYVPVEKRVEIW